MENQVDRKDLKNQALLERIGMLTSQYENQVADLRVELTVTAAELGLAQKKLDEWEKSSESKKANKEAPKSTN